MQTYIDHIGQLVQSDDVLCFDGLLRSIDDVVFVDTIQHFASYDHVIAGERGYELYLDYFM